MDIQNVLVSVIVPIYNAEIHLRQCIDSIITQTLTDIEIILVDDGSTDSSLSIIREYEANDTRVKVLTQENKFAGAARNAGKAIAKGKYLVFWDSDDYFAPTALEEMYNQCEVDNASVCVCGVYHFFEDTQIAAPASGYLNKNFLPASIPFNASSNPDFILNFVSAHPWNKMFLKSYIADINLDFQTTRNGNDIYFVINAICMASCITIVNSKLIYYRVNQEESLFSSLSNAPLVPINNWISTRENLIRNDVFPEQSFFNKVLSTIIYFLRNINNWDSFKTTIDFLQSEGLEKLGLDQEHDSDYFYYAWHKDALEHIKNDSAENILIFIHSKTYNQLKAIKANRNISREKFLDAKSKLTKLRVQRDKYKKKIRKLKKQNKELKQKYNEAISSKSYKIGRIITAIPRKILNIFKH